MGLEKVNWITEELKKLKSLLDAGVLSQEEFDVKRDELLEMLEKITKQSKTSQDNETTKTVNRTAGQAFGRWFGSAMIIAGIVSFSTLVFSEFVLGIPGREGMSNGGLVGFIASIVIAVCWKKGTLNDWVSASCITGVCLAALVIIVSSVISSAT